MTQTVKLLFSVFAFVLAFVLVVLFPGAGWEAGVVGAVAGIAQALGFTKWRTQLDDAKKWFQSKTKFGAIAGFVLVAVSLIITYLLPLFGIHFIPSGWLQEAFKWGMGVSGATILYGIFDAFQKRIDSTV